MYEVIHFFTDLQDFNHPYNVGDTFPRCGLKVGVERLNELSGPNNRQGKPLIKKIENEPVVCAYSKSEINRMPVAELKVLAEKENIADFEEKTGAELKKLLIQKYGL